MAIGERLKAPGAHPMRASTITPLFDDLRWEPSKFIGVRDRIVVAARITGSGKSSGTPSEIGLFQVATVRAGRPVRLESYTERADAREAASLLE